MARCDPQLGVVNIRRDDLNKSSFSVLATHQIDKFIVDESALWVKEATAWTELVEKEQFLLLADFAVITLGRLFLEVLPFLQLLAIRKRDAVYTLQTLAVTVAFPVGARVLGQLERLDLASVFDVGTAAQVN